MGGPPRSVLLVGLLTGACLLALGGWAAVTAEDVSQATQDNETYELTMDNTGEAYSLGFPLDVNGTLEDVFVNGTDGVGAVWTFEDDSWTYVTDFESIEPGARDAVVVSTTGDGPDTIDLSVTFEPADNGFGLPDIERPVDAGWNFISAQTCEPAEGSFFANPLEGEDTSLLVSEQLPGPDSPDTTGGDTFGTYVMGSHEWNATVPDVDPFTGYFAFYEESADVLKLEDPEDLANEC